MGLLLGAERLLKWHQENFVMGVVSKAAITWTWEVKYSTVFFGVISFILMHVQTQCLWIFWNAKAKFWQLDGLGKKLVNWSFLIYISKKNKEWVKLWSLLNDCYCRDRYFSNALRSLDIVYYIHFIIRNQIIRKKYSIFFKDKKLSNHVPSV